MYRCQFCDLFEYGFLFVGRHVLVDDHESGQILRQVARELGERGSDILAM